MYFAAGILPYEDQEAGVTLPYLEKSVCEALVAVAVKKLEGGAMGHTLTQTLTEKPVLWANPKNITDTFKIAQMLI